MFLTDMMSVKNYQKIILLKKITSYFACEWITNRTKLVKKSLIFLPTGVPTQRTVFRPIAKCDNEIILIFLSLILLSGKLVVRRPCLKIRQFDLGATGKLGPVNVTPIYI